MTEGGERKRREEKKSGERARMIVRNEQRRVNISSGLMAKLLHVGSVGFGAGIPLEFRFI